MKSLDLVNLRAEAIRRSQHPHVEYTKACTEGVCEGDRYKRRPGKTALACHKDLRRFRLLEGANGTGKSFALCQEIVWFLTGKHPFRKIPTNVDAYLLVLSRQQAAKTWAPYLLGNGARNGVWGQGGYLPDWEIARKKNGDPMVSWDSAAGITLPTKITCKSGNSLIFAWHGCADAWKRVQGAGTDMRPVFCAFVDEAGDDTRMFFDEITQRFRVSLAEHEHGGGMLWALTDTTGNEVVQEWSDAAESDPEHYVHYHLQVGENPIMTKQVVSELAVGLSKDEADIRVYGRRRRIDEFRIIQNFDRDRHCRTSPYEQLDRDNVIISYDPGSNDDVGILFALINETYPHRLNIVHFFTGKRLTIAQEAREIRRWLRGRRIRALTYDKHGATRKEKGPGKSILEQLVEHLMDNRLWVTGSPNLIPPRGRNKEEGVKRIMTMLEPPSHMWDGQPQILVDPPDDRNGLGKFIREITTYRIKQNAHSRKVRDDTTTGKNEEGPDCLRYLCMCGLQWRDYGQNLPTIPLFDRPVREQEEEELDPVLESSMKRMDFRAKRKRKGLGVFDALSREGLI